MTNPSDDDQRQANSTESDDLLRAATYPDGSLKMGHAFALAADAPMREAEAAQSKESAASSESAAAKETAAENSSEEK